MIIGDKIILKNHPEVSGKFELEEYSINSRVFLHANKIPITSPEGEPWEIVCISQDRNCVNTYEATWKRAEISLARFKEEI